ncbi:hypothetical protein [Pontibacter sp. H249]|uniref:hypothetical protein n=1 Tax=Pontibacter sp. H249 TaxID=3133420 RepID=UPI0030BA7F91
MFLLRLKHWQAFLLVFILPFILRYALTQLIAAAQPDAPGIISTLVDALPTFVPVLWLWWVGLYLRNKLSDSTRVSAVYFQLAALYFALYILLLIYTLGIVREALAEGTLQLGLIALLLPMHLFATFCYLYVVYFVARCITTLEKQRVVATGEYIGVLVQIIFLPIGIWFIQPRLNKALPETTN